MNDFLNTPIEFLKGVGPKRGELLRKEIQVYSYGDLLNHVPFRYIDRSKYLKIAHINSDTAAIQIKGAVSHVDEIGEKRKKRLVAAFHDDTGTIELIWFQGIKWVKPMLKRGVEMIVYGKPSFFNGKVSISHPEIEVISNTSKNQRRFQPVYPSTEKLTKEGLHSKGIEKLTTKLIEELRQKIPNVLSEEIEKELHFISRFQAYKELHVPSDVELLKKAQLRLKFEELFFLQMRLVKMNLVKKRAYQGHKFEVVGSYFEEFYTNHLPFELTGAQKRVVKEIRKDLGSGLHMNRLLQGDVGSGKTLVSLLVMLIALGNDFQACIVAPTEILAQQHYQTIQEFLAEMNVKVKLLTGSTKKKDRTILHEELQNGDLQILVGTHAVFEAEVKFKNLGLAVIDEQHRFGVAQRARLWKKNTNPPHILVMTATPIPRTLAMTFYGDLDVSVIDELPKGRKPIKTLHYYEKSRIRMFGFIEQEIQKGRQVYIVYPLIEESEHFEYKNLMEGYESIARRFPLPKYKVSVVHGKMKPEEKDYEMQQFAEGKTQIMVATTVIEVGVNVPNASIMVIENAEKFGLSQLHQLRGRVGRGAEQSYCILMTSYKISKDAKVRLETMVRTNDGFEISEVDLKLRGPGNMMGTEQSGVLNLKIADISRDNMILIKARDVAIRVLKEDPSLNMDKNKMIREYLIEIEKKNPNWSLVS